MLKNIRYLGAWAILLAIVLLNAFVIGSLMSSGKAEGSLSTKSINIASVNAADNQLTYGHDITLQDPQMQVTDGAQADKKPEGVKYVIKQGDTLWDISETYKIDIASITDANNMSSPDSLKIGQEILIPNATTVKEVVHSTAAAKPAAKQSSTTKLASRSSSSTSLSGMWPVSGHITSPFGMRDGKLHKGIDIAAPTGANVYAFNDGKVVFSGWNDGGYGYLVIISHGNGLETYYGHNSKLLVTVGQTVSKGQHIAEVGSTGDADGSHCHFEVRKNGTPVNPLNYLR
jgi:murein DD-endopeptidase MepM/ murein hydrolase activator NlpD